MRTERAIDHSESAGASSCGSPRAITTPVASREIGLLAGARSVGYPHSAGGKASARRSKKHVHQPRTAVAWIQICLSQYSAPVAIIDP